jgi:hypothetical protein
VDNGTGSIERFVAEQLAAWEVPGDYLRTSLLMPLGMDRSNLSVGDMEADPDHAYGLGWLIGRYRDHRLFEHAGGIDGFQTECMLLPDHGQPLGVFRPKT